MTCTSNELNWLAGLLEGEGWFGLWKGQANKKRYPRISLQMVDEDTVRKAQRACGVGHVNGPYNKGKVQPTWMWAVTDSRDAAALMMTVLPLMGARRQARIREILLEWRANGT